MKNLSSMFTSFDDDNDSDFDMDMPTGQFNKWFLFHLRLAEARRIYYFSCVSGVNFSPIFRCSSFL